MKFDEKYTTSELKDTDALLDSKEQTEQSKTVISNDTYSTNEMIGELIKTLTRLKL